MDTPAEALKVDTQKANTNQKYAVVLYGATSFVGQITARYLAQFLASASDQAAVSWAIAGRVTFRFFACIKKALCAQILF